MLGKTKHNASKSLIQRGLLVVIFLAASLAQAATVSGTVTAISGNTLTVKDAQGNNQQVQVPSSASVLSLPPGETDIKNKSTAIQFSDLAVNDRVLITLDPNAASGTQSAARVIAIKATDLAKKQQADAAAWRNGASGLVKTADAASGDIMVKTGSGPAEKTVTVHTDKTTILKRYAPTSISYDSATVAPFSAIQPGDQLTARGAKSADGSTVTAAEVVTGSFRNISGQIESVDAGNSTFTLKDLATKKQVTVHVTADAQMKKLDARVAQMLAARLNGTSAAAGGRGGAGGAAAGGGQRGAGGQVMDPQQMLSRAPAIHFADLQKGDAVMLVSSSGTSDVTAITLIAGVEAILDAPAGSDLLSNWSMGGGGGEGGTE